MRMPTHAVRISEKLDFWGSVSSTQNRVFFFQRKIRLSDRLLPYKSANPRVWFTNMVNRQPHKEIELWCRENDIPCESFSTHSTHVQLPTEQRLLLPWAPEYHRISFRSDEDFMAFKLTHCDASVEMIPVLSEKN